ncbi:MAG: hypothetical protein HQ567_32665 [Candidatus Nealsonbacteria bacterium]|nr:hypothetical protein [Candidatus Nealsonbacteria bacterium]
MNRLFRVWTFWLCCLLVGGCLAFHGELVSHASAADTETSRLWGAAGQRWKPAGRLPDFSYAGYHRGERPLPDRRADVSVKDFGAVGDGKTDDTAAIRRAVNEARGKVIALPRGRYLITDIIEIRDSGTVLQGAGPQQTVLYVPKPLEKIRSNMGATTSGRPTSNYSWSGGIIWAKGQWDAKTLSKVTAPARRGETALVVDRPDRFKVGDEVRLALRDDSRHSLTHHLYDGDPGDFANLGSVRESWIARVAQADRTTQRIVFDRPLRTDVRLEWQPVLYPARSTAEEIGIEHLAFEFPVTPYQGHFTELGYNAIAYSGVRNAWVRNVEIRHADSGLFIGGANTTVTGVTWTSGRARDGGRNATGHHGITLGGTDQLLSDFDFRTKFIHDVTMSRGSAGNVVRGGRGEDLTFDHHKYANHANLFTDVDAGVGTNIFRSGGGAKLGRHCGAWTTWWNIRTDRPVAFPAGWATDTINLVGVRADTPTVTDADGRWFEVIPPERLRPSDLYEAQLKRRLGAAK